MSIATFHDLSGCLVELVPDAGIGLSGSNLITWTDQSGSANSATLANAIANGFATATGPIYSANDAAFGGKPSIVWGNPATSCLDCPLISPSIQSPFTFLWAGCEQSQLNNGSRSIGDRLPTASSATNSRVTVFRANGTTTSPEDSLLIGVGSTTPAATASRRIAQANMRRPFIEAVIYRASAVATVVHNGIVRAHRAVPTTGGGPPFFSGMRFGRDFTNAVDGQEWTGPLSLFVLYNRELSRSELKDAMALASSKCGIPIVTGRLAA